MPVLIVEDYQESREQLERCLTRRDYDVATAEIYKPVLFFWTSSDSMPSSLTLPFPTGRVTRSSVKLGAAGFAPWASPCQVTRIRPMSTRRERPDYNITCRTQSIAIISALFSKKAVPVRPMPRPRSKISQIDPYGLFATRFIYSCARLFRRATPALCACRRRHRRCSGSHLRETVRAISTRASPRLEFAADNASFNCRRQSG